MATTHIFNIWQQLQQNENEIFYFLVSKKVIQQFCFLSNEKLDTGKLKASEGKKCLQRISICRSELTKMKLA